MKKRLSDMVTFLMVLTTCFVASCGEEKTVLPDPTVDFIQTAEITFEGVNSDEQCIEFNSPKAWIAEVHQTVKWLEVTPQKGEAGPAQIKLNTISDNLTSPSARTATIDIFVDGYQAYTINVEQKSAATSDVTLSGHIDNGVMNLESDATGTKFLDTIYVASKTEWSIEVESASKDVLSFTKKEAEQGAENQETMLIVTADYAKFASTSFSGKFYVKTVSGGAVPVEVNAQASASVYDTSKHLQNETERTSFNLVDTIQHGVFQTTFYVDANVRWTLQGTPDWIETAADWGSKTSVAGSNVKDDGTIRKDRQPVTLRVKESMLSAEGKTCQLTLTDDRGMELQTLSIIFAGVGSNYMDYDIILPASDVNGNPWAFEARQSTVEEEGPYNRRRISIDFTMVTSADYSSIDDAPFHILLVDATNGMPHKNEHHWATLKMGNAADAVKMDNGMYQKKLWLVANERGDADDTDKVTVRSEVRNAFVYIVPREVSFDDLWNANGTLKEEYANDLSLVSQKNDPEADYRFALEGVENGSTISVKPEGEQLTFDVVKGSYNKCDINIEKLNADGEWTKTSDCTFTYTKDDYDNPLTITFSFTKNESTYNRFTREWEGSPRDIRIQVVAFIGDNEGSKVIYTFYAHQDMCTE